MLISDSQGKLYSHDIYLQKTWIRLFQIFRYPAWQLGTTSNLHIGPPISAASSIMCIPFLFLILHALPFIFKYFINPMVHWLNIFSGRATSIHVGRDLDDSKRRFRPLLGAEREREEKGLERRTPLQETYGFSATAKASLPPSAPSTLLPPSLS